MRHTMLIVATILAAVPTAVPAQSAIPIGARVSSDFHLATPRLDSSNVDRRRYHPSSRLGPAFLGGAAGAVVLGGLALAATAGCTGGDRCDGNIAVFIAGALLGGIVGSAVGAAVPTGRGLCTPTQRLGMGIGGAFLGAFGVVVPPLFVATVPMGSVMFMRNC